MPRKVLAAAVVCAAASWAVFAADKDKVPAKSTTPPAADAAAETDANKWMKVKLHSSQEILAGLTEGDLKAVETNAARMLLMNALEEWKNDTEFTRHSEYDAQLNAFEYATKELIRTSRNNDIDGALDAYGRLTRSCVKCHQVIRDTAPAK